MPLTAAAAAVVIDSRHPPSITMLPYAPRCSRRCSRHVASSVVRCTSPPLSFAAHRRPSPPTPANQKNTPSTSTFVRCRHNARPRGISWTGDKPHEYPRRIWNHQLPSRDRSGRGRPPPWPVIALRGHRGLDPHRICRRRPRRLRRRCPTIGGISPEVSPHHPHVLTRRVQLRVRRYLVQNRVMSRGV